MNRSLGADIYSPIRIDSSFNDSISNADGSISESFSGAYSTGFKKEKKSLEPIKDEDSCELQNKEHVGLFKAHDKNCRANLGLSRKNSKLLFPSYKDVKFSSSPDSVYAPSPKKSSLLHDEPIKKKQAILEKYPQIKKTKHAEKQTKDGLVTKRNSKRNLVPDKFITVRNESRRSNLSFEVKTDLSSDCALSISNKEGSSELLEANTNLRVDCSTQTDLTLTDLQNLMKEANLQSNADNKSGFAAKMSSETFTGCPVNIPSQAQVNALDKLKDTIEDEFHGIRQILYLQQLSLGKLLYKNMEEVENTHSGVKVVAEGLNTIIDLLQGDQQLRNAVLSHQFHS